MAAWSRRRHVSPTATRDDGLGVQAPGAVPPIEALRRAEAPDRRRNSRTATSFSVDSSGRSDRRRCCDVPLRAGTRTGLRETADRPGREAIDTVDARSEAVSDALRLLRRAPCLPHTVVMIGAMPPGMSRAILNVSGGFPTLVGEFSVLGTSMAHLVHQHSEWDTAYDVKEHPFPRPDRAAPDERNTWSL